MKIHVKDQIAFKTLLIKKGMTQAELARKIKTSRAYVSLIVNGNKTPSPKMAKAFTDALNTEFDNIFFIDNAC